MVEGMGGIHLTRGGPEAAPRIGSVIRPDEVETANVSSWVPACIAGPSKILPWERTRLRRDRCET